MIDYKFFDTSALLELTSNVDKPIYISSITLKELENIKISNNKSEEVKYKARRIIKQIDEHPELYRFPPSDSPEVKQHTLRWASLILLTEYSICFLHSVHDLKHMGQSGLLCGLPFLWNRIIPSFRKRITS